MTAQRTTRLLTHSATALALCVPSVALSQEPNPNITVESRPRPEFDPLGIRAGAFLVFPEVSVAETYDDNVALVEDGEESDFVTRIQPSVVAESQWSRHALSVGAFGDFAIHAEQDEEDFQDFGGTIDGRLDITSRANLGLALEGGQGHEGRDDPEDTGNDGEITDLYYYGGSLTFRQEFNRFNYQLEGAYERTDFDDIDEDGDGIDDDRDRDVYDALLRTGYLVSPRLNMFLEGRYNVEKRDQDVIGGVERGSDGWEGRLGAEVDITAVVFGEFFVGYRRQNFDDANFDSDDGISFGVDLNWNPTQLTSIGLSGTRDFRPTDQAGAASNFRTEVGLEIDHELRRNLLVGGEAAYINDSFEGNDREDDTYILGAGLSYLLNRNLTLDGSYQFSDRDSNFDGESFTDNQFTIGLTARL